MIEGFKLRVTSNELKTHCEERSEYHRARSEEKRASLPELKQALECMKRTGTSPKLSSMNNKTNYAFNSSEPIEDLESDIEEHYKKSLVFDFFSKHLFDEDYVLQETDLTRLEILKR